MKPIKYLRLKRGEAPDGSPYPAEVRVYANESGVLHAIQHDGSDAPVGGGGGSVSVTDGGTTVDPATSLDFASGATVSDGGGGIAQVDVAAGAVAVTDGSTTVDPASSLSFTGATVSDEGAGVAGVAVGGSMPQGVWLPDKPPASANAADQEYATMDIGVGVPDGWTAYDPTEGSLDVSIVGPGLQLLRTDAVPYGGDQTVTPIPNGTMLDNTTFDTSGFICKFPTRLALIVFLNGSGADLTGATITVNGTDLTGAPQSEVLSAWSEGDARATDTVWGAGASITGVVVAGITGLTGVETIQGGLGDANNNITSTVGGIYIPDLGSDFSAVTKVCSAKDSDYTVYSISGFAFFEDATDLTKQIAILGHHWFGDSAYASYSDVYAQTSFNEGTEVYSQYLRVRRNGTDYYLDVSVGGLAFTSGNPTTSPPIDIGFVPAHFGLVMDNDFSAVFEFLRFIDSDVTLYGIAEGARA